MPFAGFQCCGRNGVNRMNWLNGKRNRHRLRKMFKEIRKAKHAVLCHRFTGNGKVVSRSVFGQLFNDLKAVCFIRCGIMPSRGTGPETVQSKPGCKKVVADLRGCVAQCLDRGLFPKERKLSRLS